MVDKAKYVETEHPQIFWCGIENRGAERERDDAVSFAEKIVEAHENLTVYVSVGQYRSYEVHWEPINEDEIWLDFYSVTPGYGYINEVKNEIGNQYPWDG